MARLFKCACNHNPLFFQKNTQLEGFNLHYHGLSAPSFVI